MVMEEKVWKYRVQFERSAVKDRDGFKVEAHADDVDEAYTAAVHLYSKAKSDTGTIEDVK